MALIRKQNEIDVYSDKDNNCITICETEGHFDEYHGKHVDVYINIDIAHIDSLIAALQKCKKEIQGDELRNG
ncbi:MULTISPECIES: hypothetical protein [Acinetobacter]|uniref:hypothetical protein n=1 Tax=Acinetobacter TaxID=469 RepID=UPI0002CE59C1|nr:MULTISPECIES: hypothetical protein [Acinetobacter]ENU08634.1 hypothetical protein F997_02081 [Acinetobacter calcoaceticus NIPH 13]MBJ9739652.1 hypothetical protein [Acinetobacter oleivorans]